jgi:hypothetical protein
MATITCVCRAEEIGRVAEINVNSNWTGLDLRNAIAEALKLSVSTMRFQCRSIHDSDMVGDVGLREGSSVFINSQDTTNVRFVRSKLRSEAIAARITVLEDLGFPRTDCEKALRASEFNVDRAADCLLRGSVPELLGI